MNREVCEHFNKVSKCDKCKKQFKIEDLIYWMLSEYDWVSSEQTKQEFIREFKSRLTGK